MSWKMERKLEHTCELRKMGVNDTDMLNYIQDWIRHEVKKAEEEVKKEIE